MNRHGIRIGIMICSCIGIFDEAQASNNMHVQKTLQNLRELNHVLIQTQNEVGAEQVHAEALYSLAAKSQALSTIFHSPPQIIPFTLISSTTSSISYFKLPQPLVIDGTPYECLDIKRRMAKVQANLTTAARIASSASQLAEWIADRSSRPTKKQPQRKLGSAVQSTGADHEAQQLLIPPHHQELTDETTALEVLRISSESVSNLESEIESLYPRAFDEKSLEVHHTWTLNRNTDTISGNPADDSPSFEPESLSIQGYTWHAGTRPIEHIPDISLEFDGKILHLRRLVSPVDACSSDISVSVTGRFTSMSSSRSLTLSGLVN